MLNFYLVNKNIKNDVYKNIFYASNYIQKVEANTTSVPLILLIVTHFNAHIRFKHQTSIQAKNFFKKMKLERVKK